MKSYLLYSLAALLLLVSCKKTNEDMAEDLITKEMQKTLKNPDTYDALETKVDSAFAPVDNPQFYALMADIGSEQMALQQCQDETIRVNEKMDEAKENISEASDQNKNEYQEYAKFLETCKNTQNEIYQRINNKLLKLQEIVNSKKQFIGFKAVHTYKAENENGEELTEKYCYIFDKEMTKVLLAIPMEKYTLLHDTYNQIKKEMLGQAADVAK